MNRFAHFLYHPCLPLGPDNRLATGSKEHIALSLEAACEGMVLLKNDGALLPLKRGVRIAVFGTAQFDYVRGGGGSGDVTTAYTRNIYEGFKLKEDDGLVEICEPVSAFYRDSVEVQKAEKGHNARCDQPELPASLIENARTFTDTAVFTICRYSWEGGDRKGEPGDGDYYLNDGEQKLLDTLKANFKNIIAVLDVGAVVDSGWFKTDPAIGAVLLAWQAGIEGGLAIADTLCGLSNPSGRLVDTFPDSFDALPSSAHFNDSKEYADYSEDIYVGYRYFTTFADCAGHVCYPFGYGLSYTTFSVEEAGYEIMSEKQAGITAITTGRLEQDISSASAAEGAIAAPVNRRLASCDDFGIIRVRARVTNTGSVPGKNAVGLYFCAPAGKLLKPARQLGAFAKTKLLAPGESEILDLFIPVADMSSFDDLGAVDKSSFILEAGTYRFYLGADVNTAVELKENFFLGDTKIVKHAAPFCTPHRLEKRLLGDGTYEQLPTDDSPITGRSTCYNDWTVPEGRVIVGHLENCRKSRGTGTGASTEAAKRDTVPDFLEVAEGRESIDEFMSRLPIEVLIELLGGQPNTGVANTFNMGNVPEFNIPSVPTADGPAGLRINRGLGVTTTAWPIATMLACTWNTELVERVGAAGALEVRENHIGLWLTPAMNIHRSPLCGRNFEYYSEDPYMTGKMGAAMIRGMQSQRIGASMKHFAANNKEEDRMICDSRVSERALREIYLRGFEIAVKEADPWSVMSSYNILNGCYSSRNHDLLTGILRGEWGFDGMVTTDWMNRSGQVPEIIAGNDLKMPIGEPETVLTAYNNGEVTRGQIELCAGRILRTILKFE